MSNSIQPNKGPHIVVLSYNNVGNFGDRLGFHLLNGVLPAHAWVTYAHFVPWDVPERQFDLLILGIGNSLFGPLLTKNLITLLERVPTSIGIFGTQYRKSIDRERITMVIDRLNMWYARYEEDVRFFGGNCKNVTHFGDWLINAFPMTYPTTDKTLRIDNKIWRDLPLDRIIQWIQKHRRVFSKRLHPLLCALTSAEQVAYSDQWHKNEPSGKFRSMLLDIFGKHFPKKEMFEVDKQAVIDYKKKVRNNIIKLQCDLTKMLEDYQT